MKKKQTIHIQEDQTFLEGINLITGLKINYDRPILTQNELNSLCIDEKLTKKQKAIKILKSGQLLQKWSLFDNLSNYLNQPQDYQQFLQLVEVKNPLKKKKYYQDLQPMLDIVAIGLLGCVNKLTESYQKKIIDIGANKQLLTQKAEQSFFRLCMRSFIDQKYNFVALDQWSQLFNQFFKYLSIVKSERLNVFTQQCLQYISGSFSMTTSPERRRIAFEMIKGLIEHSQKVMQRAKTKAVFFNNDTNSKTRSVICEAMGKLLLLRPEDDQIRKFLLDYFNDIDQLVVEKSFFVLSEIPHQKHLEAILDAIEQQEDFELISGLVLDNLQNFVQTFHHLIRENRRFKLIFINLINSVLKSEDGQKILKLFPLLIKIYNLIYITKKQRQQQNLFDVFVIQNLDFEEEDNFKALIKLYKIALQDEKNHSTTKSFEFYLHKNIKSQKIKTSFSKNLENLRLFLSIFTYETEEENNTYTTFLTKAVEESKWAQVEFLLQELSKVPLNEQSFDKISMSLFKLILHCPYYLLEMVCQSILYLLLSKRKHLEFFLSLKDKLHCSKTWMQRRNYIILYAQIKAGSSYEFHKTVPVLNYKLIVKEKCIGVKLEFLKYAIKIYQSIDPESKLEKLALKQCLSQICNENDSDVSESANFIKEKILQSEIDFSQLQKIAQRNSYFMIQQEKMRQKDALILKKTKTQRQLGRKDSKCKTITAESRTSLRLHKDLSKDFVKKQITIVNVDKLKRPTTVTNNNRSFQQQQRSEKSDKVQEDKKNSSIPIMPRIMSGQVKTATKALTLKRQSGFKK